MTDLPGGSFVAVGQFDIAPINLPPQYLTIGELVRISLQDGSIEYGADYQPDGAARRFWEAISAAHGSPEAVFGHGLSARVDEEMASLREQLAEARMWARHGYEIGQRSCTWSDHGVAPAWLTENQPNTQSAAVEPERDPIEVHSYERGYGRGLGWMWRCSGFRHCPGGFIGLDHDSETSARAEADRHAREAHGAVETEKQLHARRACPGWQYATTEGPRKQWDDADRPPEGDGWERNVDAGRDGWERFDYTEESYWRRRAAG